MMPLTNKKTMSYNRIMTKADLLPHITEREQEVLTLLSEGLTVREVAAELYLSHHSVISHKKNLYEKLDVWNCFQLGVMAERLDLLKENQTTAAI